MKSLADSFCGLFKSKSATLFVGIFFYQTWSRCQPCARQCEPYRERCPKPVRQRQLVCVGFPSPMPKKISRRGSPRSLVYLCVCVCVFIKLHITAQSGLVILVILCHSCVCVFLLPILLDFNGRPSQGHTGRR